MYLSKTNPSFADMLAKLRRIIIDDVFRGRNMSPQNVNETCSYVPRRLLSLQYTILVLSG